MLGDKTLNQRVAELLTNAVAVLAVGNYASYGGLIADKVLQPPPNFIQPSWSPSPTGTVGFFDDPLRGYKGLLSRFYEDNYLNVREAAAPFYTFVKNPNAYLDNTPSPSASVKPAIAVPGCPANGNGIMRTLANLWADGLGYDFLRAIRSFDPCLVCAAHFEIKGKNRKLEHIITLVGNA